MPRACVCKKIPHKHVVCFYCLWTNQEPIFRSCDQSRHRQNGNVNKVGDDVFRDVFAKSSIDLRGSVCPVSTYKARRRNIYGMSERGTSQVGTGRMGPAQSILAIYYALG